jgi:hypothetical protein
MRQAVNMLVMMVLVMVAWPVPADLEESEMARVVTGYGRPADCLAPVAINKIDGELRAVSAKGFLIEPGLHSINGRATLDLNNTHCRMTGDDRQFGSIPDLEVDFEAGGIYHIGFDHSSENTQEWKLLVWKVDLSILPGPGDQ